jgi:selenium metabolism protein YedF
MQEIDARGLACPAPVLRAKAAIDGDGADELTVVVDNDASHQNVRRFLETQGFSVTVNQTGADYRISAHRTGGPPPAESAAPSAKPAPAGERKIAVMITSDRMGHGDDVLGAKLMVNFVNTLAEMGPELWRLIFVNSGVKLTIDGSEVLSTLKGYAEGGLQILVCGTCLDHFGLLDQKQVGETTNMLDIVTAAQLADSVINI